VSDNSAIEWCDTTWNPVLGCTRVSPGCDSCYAIVQARIRAGNPNPKVAAAFAGLTERANGRVDWTGQVNLLPERLEQPFRWRNPRKVFVNSLADLFHKNVPDEFIAQVFEVMAATPQHTYQVLTKQQARLRAWLNRCQPWSGYITHNGHPPSSYGGSGVIVGNTDTWPLRNVWIGVSVESQKWADIRIPALLDTPAATRFVSAEPLLGPVNLAPWLPVPAGAFCEAHWSWLCGNDINGGECRRTRLSWVIAGGESGPGARPMSEDWARAIVWQGRSTRVPVFVKQLGSVLGRQMGAGSKGGDWDAWPEDLRVREFPVAAGLAGAR